MDCDESGEITVNSNAAGEVTLVHCGKNLAPLMALSTNVAGVTYTRLSDGRISVKGTCSTETWPQYVSQENAIWLPAGSYRITADGIPSNLQLTWMSEDQSLRIFLNYPSGTAFNSATFTLSEPTKMHGFFTQRQGGVFDTVISIQLEAGTNKTDYEPYVCEKLTNITTPVGLKPYVGVNTIYTETGDVLNASYGKPITTIVDEEIGKKLDELGIEPDGTWELIEKCIIGYELLTEQPSDWDTNWTAYYKNTGTKIEPVYTQLTDAAAPSWVTDTYYNYSGEGATFRRYYPEDENYRFKAMMVFFEATGNASPAGFSYFRHNNGAIAQYWFGEKTSTAKQYAMTRIEMDHGYWLVSYSSWNNYGDNKLNYYINNNVNKWSVANYPYVNHVDISQTLAAGTQITIWGVRI